MKVAFLTLGCKVNYYETEKMAEQFKKRGYEVVDFEEPADIYVVNTCTVTNIADRKSRQMLHRAKKKNPGSVVVAVGCYVESGKEELKKDKTVDIVLSNSEKEKAAEIIEKKAYDLIEERAGIRGGFMSSEKSFHKEREKRTRAYLKIQDGCNQFCTYCMIPYVRGGGTLRSKPIDEVVCQVERLEREGYKEVVLTGIHVSSYGVDFVDDEKEMKKTDLSENLSGDSESGIFEEPEESREIEKKYSAHDFVKLEGKYLIEVIQKISEIEGIKRIRLSSLEPRIISENFLKELVKIPKVCPHFHLSLQSGCDTVLRRMNRHYTTVEYKEKVDLLRSFYENPAITTDVIVGFPGETDQEFEQTLQYLRELRLSDIHVFKYSERSGTRAAAMKDQVRPEIKNERSDRLLRDTKEYRRAYAGSFLGKKESVLFEETVVEDGKAYLAGHNERYVMIGVPLEKAGEKKYSTNEIWNIEVEKVLGI